MSSRVNSEHWAKVQKAKKNSAEKRNPKRGSKK
jgi:hypothetical protein